MPAIKERSSADTSDFYGIIGDSRDWANYFTAEDYEEMTDVAERLRAPMDHTITFQNVGGGLYCGSSVRGDDLLIISKNAELVAQEMAQRDPAWAVEALRRSIETQEVMAAADLPQGSQMLVFSPIPDSVKSGAVNIGGYNLEKQTAMVRVWTHNDEGLSCRYISLDGGNRTALTAAARAVEREIPSQYSPEEILATFYTFLGGEIDVAERVIDGYDAEMKRISGRDHSYGRPGLNHQKALDIAAENPARLAEHMAEIRALKWQYSGAELDKKLEEARYNYAAALDQTTRGEAVASNAVAGSMARATGTNFAGYCASSSNANAPNSTQAAYESMFGRRKVTGKCPCCGELTTYDPCNPKCTICDSDSKTNRAAEYFAKKRAIKDKAEQTKSEHHEAVKTPEKRQLDQKYGAKILGRIKKFYWGESAFANIERAVGYYGETIATGQDARKLYDMKYNLN
jgi:hypothetical protein